MKQITNISKFKIIICIYKVETVSLEETHSNNYQDIMGKLILWSKTCLQLLTTLKFINVYHELS